MSASALRAVGLCASPNRSQSRSGRLLDHALARLATLDVPARRIDLGELPADALLGRARHALVDEAIGATIQAQIVIAATPVYRATYSGLLKVFLDLFPHGGLTGRVVVPIATGGSQAHLLALDHGLRPLFASLGALVTASGIYASPEQFAGDAPDAALFDRVGRAVVEAVALARSLELSDLLPTESR
jgi:FMN reductase